MTGIAIFFCAIGALLANIVILWHIHWHDQQEGKRVQVQISAAVVDEIVKAAMVRAGTKP
jgi:ACT domain-containing protein